MSGNIFKKLLKTGLSSHKQASFLAFLLLISFIFNTFFIFFPKKAHHLSTQFFKPRPLKKLSRVEFSPDANSPKFRVIKFKKKDKIYLDILSEKPDGSYEQTQLLELKGNQEAYFDYWEESLSLFVLDYDGDGKLDLGVPSFDSFLKAHFELLIYNEDTGKFELKKMNQEPKIEKRVQQASF